MKTIFALFIALVALSAHSQQGNYIDAAGTVQQRANDYIRGGVINGASSTIIAGKAVCLDLTDDDGIHVDYCAVAANKPLCVMTESCAVGKRCKCQTKGYFASGQLDVFGPGLATAGGVVYASVNGYLYGIGVPTASQFPVGIALDSKSSSGDLEIYISL